MPDQLPELPDGEEPPEKPDGVDGVPGGNPPDDLPEIPAGEEPPSRPDEPDGNMPQPPQGMPGRNFSGMNGMGGYNAMNFAMNMR